MGKRIWSQSVLEDGVLALIHPDGRQAVHQFPPRLKDEIEKLKWFHHDSGSARAWYPNVGTIELAWLCVNAEPNRGNAIDSFQVQHLNSDRSDCRDNNLILDVRRINHQNENDAHRSPDGYSISKRKKDHKHRYDEYRVRVRFEGKRIYEPTFRKLEAAKKCRDSFAAIALEVDKGNRTAPLKSELMLEAIKADYL